MNQQTPPNTPKTVSELFPSKWLKASDLSRPVTVKIDNIDFETVYDQQSRQHVIKLVVSFEGAHKRLIPNKTQCESIWAITGSETFTNWPGHMVTLAPGRSHNNQPTIIVSEPQPQEESPQENNIPS